MVLTLHQILQEFVKLGYISTDEYLTIKVMPEKEQVILLREIADSEIDVQQRVVESLQKYKPTK
jgi:hypothetical protein